MITVVAFAVVTIVAWLVSRANDKDRSTYDHLSGGDATYTLLLHIRQDIKLLCFLAGGIIVMLGVIADILLKA